MFQPGDIAKVAAILFVVDTVVKGSTGEQQERTAESFVPEALGVLQEANRAIGTGVAKYLEDARQEREKGAEAVAPAETQPE